MKPQGNRYDKLIVHYQPAVLPCRERGQAMQISTLRQKRCSARRRCGEGDRAFGTGSHQRVFSDSAFKKE